MPPAAPRSGLSEPIHNPQPTTGLGPLRAQAHKQHALSPKWDLRTQGSQTPCWCPGLGRFHTFIEDQTAAPWGWCPSSSRNTQGVSSHPLPLRQPCGRRCWKSKGRVVRAQHLPSCGAMHGFVPPAVAIPIQSSQERGVL